MLKAKARELLRRMHSAPQDKNDPSSLASTTVLEAIKVTASLYPGIAVLKLCHQG
jgi:hypothetical protein